jgi:hypothetical protein
LERKIDQIISWGVCKIRFNYVTFFEWIN